MLYRGPYLEDCSEDRSCRILCSSLERRGSRSCGELLSDCETDGVRGDAVFMGAVLDCRESDPLAGRVWREARREGWLVGGCGCFVAERAVRGCSW